MTFILTGGSEHVRLKSYDATIKGKTTLLRITVEVTDSWELSYLLRGLEDLDAQQKQEKARAREPAQRAASTRKKIEKQVMLALPPPRRDEWEGS